MNRVYLIIALFFLIGFSLSTFFFSQIKPNEFFYIGDQFLRLTLHEAFIGSFFIRKIEDLSLLNGWQFMAQFWDAVYYLILYFLNLSFITAEKILFFTVLMLSLTLSFVGFKKINSLVTDRSNALVLFVVTIWYCFNPYVVMLWHGGVFNLGTSLTYSLAPLIFYYYHVAIFQVSSLRNKIILALLLAISSFAFWLLAPLGFLLVLYSVLYLLIKYKSVPRALKNILMLLVLYLPMVCFVLFNILFEYFNNAGNNNTNFNATFGNQLGGIWFQVLMLFSWGIYQVWTPRAMYSFHKYYFTSNYINATLSIYAVIIVGVLTHYFFLISKLLLRNKIIFKKIPPTIANYLKEKTKKLKFDICSRLLIIFSLLLFISLFLAKAAQPPFGELFLYLYENVPFFSVFRTADIRFGFSVVLCIGILFVLISRSLNKYILSGVIVAIIYFQSVIFFNGTAVKGENIKGQFYDRAIYFSKDYQDVINFLNKDTTQSSYVLPLPAVEYSDYIFDKGEHHYGQDLLSKPVDKPFIYLSLSKGISKNTYEKLNRIITNKELETLNDFPIQYLILRSDISCTECEIPSEKELSSEFANAYKNKTFTVYRIEDSPKIINVLDSMFTVINPVKFRINLKNVSSKKKIELLLSFNKDWKLFMSPVEKYKCQNKIAYIHLRTEECVDSLKFFEGEELAYLWSQPLAASTHTLSRGYANSWNVDPYIVKNNFDKKYYTVNKDGSIDFDLIVYFRPQSWFYLSFIISFISVIVSFWYLIKSNKKYVRNKK